MIDLATCKTVKSAEQKANKRYALEIATADDVEFLMYADNEKEKDEWIGFVGRAIVRCSSTYTVDDGMEGHDSDGSDD